MFFVVRGLGLRRKDNAEIARHHYCTFPAFSIYAAANSPLSNEVSPIAYPQPL